MILVTNLSYKAGMTTILPEVGKVTFSAEGQIEVTAEEGLFLLGLMPEFSEVLIKADDLPVETPQPLALNTEQVVSGVTDDGAVDSEKVELVQLTKPVEEHSAAELKKIAEENNFPDGEWASLKKADLIKYMQGKYQAI